MSGRRSRFQARCGIRRFGSRWTPRLRRSRCSPGMQARRGSPTRFAYNECLRFVTDALAAKRNDPSVKVPWSGYDLINAFNAWKRSEEAGRVFVVDTNGLISRQVTGLAWRQKVSAQVFEEAAVDLGRSLAAYGRAKQDALGSRRFGFPRRKRKGRCRDSFRLRNKRQSGGCLLRVGDGPLRSVTLPTIGRVRVHDDTRRLRQLLRPRAQIDPATGEQRVAPRAKILFATIARRGTRWYVSLNVHAPDVHPERDHQPCPEREGGGYVGVDVGLVAFAVAARSDGTEVGRWQAKHPLSSRLRRLQRSSRSLSRAQRGSRNHAKAARRLRREHARVADARRSFLQRSRASWSRTTPCWPSRTLPSTISSATTALPAPSGTPLGPSSPVSSPTRPAGSGWISWFATVGSRQVGPARRAAPSKCD